jgi:hypothetical protein
MELGEDYYQISRTRISQFELFKEFIPTKTSSMKKVGKTKKKKLSTQGSTNKVGGIWGGLKLVKVA